MSKCNRVGCYLKPLGIAAAIALLLGCRKPEPPRDSLRSAEFSPDGKWIVFSYSRSLQRRIFRAKPDGSNVERLTGTDGRDADPSYSPDGSQIVFSSIRGEDRGDICVMNADGSNVRRLTQGPDVDLYPVFSPDGKDVYFLRARRYEKYSPIAPKQWHGWDIFRINVDGSGLTAITDGDYYGIRGLSITPDGKHLLTTIVVGSGDKLFCIDLTATSDPKPMVPILPTVSETVVRDRGAKPLAQERFFDYSLSRDGQYVVFVGDGGWAIFLMDWKKREVIRRLTNMETFMSSPRFSPDGKKVIFLVERGHCRNPYYELWETSTDGKFDQRRIDLPIPE